MREGVVGAVAVATVAGAVAGGGVAVLAQALSMIAKREDSKIRMPWTMPVESPHRNACHRRESAL